MGDVFGNGRAIIPYNKTLATMIQEGKGLSNFTEPSVKNEYLNTLS